jgi:deoxyribonuclease IV
VKQKFGVHASIAGGLHNALLSGRQLGCDCLQIFVKNQRQWEAPPLTDEQVAQWKAAWQENPCSPVVAHGTYLVNLAARDRVIRKKSIREFVDEVQRCEALGLSGLITHPGSHGGDGEAKGIKRVIAAIKEILDKTSACKTNVLLEITAGQGNCLGHRFEHLAEMIEGAGGDRRLGVCLDTCHLHAAGYNLARQEGYEAMVGDLLRCLPIERVRCIHVNDSIKPAGSRVDRHTHIGKGTIGREGFRRLLRDGRFVHISKILETPKEVAPDGRDYDAVNLEVLRRLASGTADKERGRRGDKEKRSNGKGGPES